MGAGKAFRWRAVAALAVVAVAMTGGATGAPTSPRTAVVKPSPAVMTYRKWCSDCHSTPTGPGSMALQRKYNGDIPAILEQRTDLTPEFVSLAVRQGISFMPSFRKTEISDAELAAVGAYLASPTARGNSKSKRP